MRPGRSRVELLREAGLHPGGVKGGKLVKELFRPVDASDELFAKMVLTCAPARGECCMLQCTLRLYGQVKNQREARVDGSVRMPAYRPHVVASFCSANLVGDHNKSFGTVNARRAGAEPWAICDYVRDALCWYVPNDALHGWQPAFPNLPTSLRGYTQADGLPVHRCRAGWDVRRRPLRVCPIRVRSKPLAADAASSAWRMMAVGCYCILVKVECCYDLKLCSFKAS